MQTLVLKFGGAAVASPDRFSTISDIILSRQQEADQVIIVVSAMGDTTDQLEALARQVHPNPPRREYDMLVTVGERISISLLAMALDAKGCEAISFTGSQSGIITCNQHSNARIIDVRPRRLFPHMFKRKAIIVAGFQGVSLEGEITTLGRGGSDTTAVALGIALGAERVEFYKDVQGVYDRNPKRNCEARLLSQLDYDMALSVISSDSHPVLHPRCIQLAQRNQMPLLVRSFCPLPLAKDHGTLIGSCRPIDQRVAPQYEEDL